MRQCLRPGDVFIDAGASVGQMSLLASHLVGQRGRVLAFEPYAVRHRDLLNSIALNGCTNIVPFNAGLGRDDGKILLFKDRGSPSMVPLDVDEAADLVALRGLDLVLEEEGVDVVRMLKVDVEGFEADVLIGATALLSSRQAPILCIEHGVYERLGTDALSVVRNANDYRFYALVRSKKHVSRLRRVKDRRNLRDGDNVFCLLPRHLEELSHSAVLR